VAEVAILFRTHGAKSTRDPCEVGTRRNPARQGDPAACQERAVKRAVASEQPLAQTARSRGAMTIPSPPGSGHSTGGSARRRRAMRPIWTRNASACGQHRPAARSSGLSSKRPPRTSPTSGRAVRLEPRAACGVVRHACVSAPGGLVQWCLRVARPAAQGPPCPRSAARGARTAGWCAGAGPLRYAAAHASGRAGGPAGAPPPPWARAAPGGAARHTTVYRPHPHGCRAGQDGRPAPAPSGVDCAHT
jgi:hypothetical protein